MKCLKIFTLQSSEDSFDYLNDNFLTVLNQPQKAVQQFTNDEAQSTTSTVSIIFNDNDEGNDGDNDESTAAPSNEHRVLVETICNISDAVERGDCNIRETTSIASLLNAHHDSKQLDTVDYERLMRFIDKAAECGLVFNDLNALYNYFIQESCRERFERGNASSASSSNTNGGARKKEENQTEADGKSENVAASVSSAGGENDKGQF